MIEPLSSILIYQSFKQKCNKFRIYTFQRFNDKFSIKYFPFINIPKMRQRQNRPFRQSPRRQMVNEELDQHTNRIKELLKADNIILEQENALLKTKCKKLNQLQDKVQLVLRQNNQLLSENQKISRLLHQNKSQNQMLKSKLDQHSNQRIGVMSEFQFKQKKYLAEIQNLHAQMSELQNIKNLQMNDVRTQCQVQIQNVKRQNTNALDVYDQQIRKLKDILNRREIEIVELSNRIKKQASEFELQVLKAKQEREKLRNEMGYMEDDNKKDLQDLRMRLDAHYMQEIDHLKRSHLANLQVIQTENLKLKQLIDHLNIENDSLRKEFQNSTGYYQDTISLLKREIDDLKLQLIDLEKISENQKIGLERELALLHQHQTGELKDIHEDHLRKLENQLISLQSVNQSKGNEIEQLIREKATARSVFDNETNRLKDQLMTYKEKVAQIETSYSTKIKSLDNKIEEKDKQITYLQQLYRDMKSSSDSQVASLKQLLSQKKIQHEKLKIASKEAEQSAIQEKNTLQNQKQTIRQALKREEKQKQIIKENLQGTLNQTENSLRSKIESLIGKVNMIDKENDGLKKNILLKDKEVKGLTERLNQSEQRQSKLQHQINQYRQKLLQKDRKNNQSLEQQKLRLEKSNAYMNQNLKSDHEAALRLEAAKQKDLRDKLSKKERELESLLKMHKKMCDEVKALTEQQANKKNIDLKFPGATADLIATKNMFDVFLKTKVLDLCGDVIPGKENVAQQ